jgi:hypothetical protein
MKLWIEKDLKKAVVAYIEGTIPALALGNSPGWDLNPGSPEYEAGMLTTRHDVRYILIMR